MRHANEGRPVAGVIAVALVGLGFIGSSIYHAPEAKLAISQQSASSLAPVLVRQSLNTLEQTPTPDIILGDSEENRIILSYLRCEELDCIDAKEDVIELGPDALAPLIQLLDRQVSANIGAELGFTRDASIIVRVRALNALGHLGDRRAFTPIKTALDDPNPLVRAAAANALGQIGEDQTVTALLPLLQDPDQLVREVAAKALERSGRPEALPALRTAAQVESNAHVRQIMEAAINTLKGN